jgi:6-phosphogluconolactonase
MKPSSLARLCTASVLSLGTAAMLAQPAHADSGTPAVSTGRVYEATNAAAGNAIQVFERANDGTLTVGALVPTGGLGAGSSLGSQGGVVRDGHHLLAVNAGDNSVTSFEVIGGQLVRRSVVSSGGVRPVSVTISDDIVYVLNAGSDSISGLRLTGDGSLQPIAGSSRLLSGTGTGAAEVKFGAGGESLIVTEKNTRKIDIFHVGEDGLATGPEVHSSVGAVPYGFDVDRRNNVIVSEAATGSVSSYHLDDDQFTVVTGSLSDTQAAPCWLLVTTNGRFAYTTNAASGTISSYAVGSDGSLTLLAAVAGSTGAGPTDVAQSRDGRFLYVRVRSGGIASFAVSSDGSLTALGTVNGATAIGPSGLAAA